MRSNRLRLAAAMAALAATLGAGTAVVVAGHPGPQSRPPVLALLGHSRYGGGLFGRRHSYGYYRPRHSIFRRVAKTLFWAYVLHLFFSSGAASILLWIVLIMLVAHLLSRRRRRRRFSL